MRAALLGLVVGLALASPAGAAVPAHDEAPAPRVLGPLLSGVGADGFGVVVAAPDGPSVTAELLVFDGGRPAPSAAPAARAASAAATWHQLRVGGLRPGRRYRYRVLLGGRSLGDGEVSTAPPPGTARPLLLAVMGDERGAETGVSPYAPAIVGAVLAEGPDLVLGTGDLVAEGADPLAWRQLMISHGPLFAQLPYFPALGNHELIGNPTGRTFRSLFPDASQGFYAVRYAQLLVLLLNGNRPGDPEQSRFLDEQLGRAAADPGVHRRLVVLHHSPLSTSAHCGLAQEMAPWIDRFERFRVDAVLSGHDHCYQRLERNGVAYFVSGGGGAPLYPPSRCAVQDHAALQRYEAAHHFLLIRIDPRRGDAMTVTARVPQGPVLDEVTLPLPRSALAPPLSREPASSALGAAPPAAGSGGASPVGAAPAAEAATSSSGWWLLGLAPVAAVALLFRRRRPQS